MGRNKYIQCPICSKKIRSDNMKLHKHEKDNVQKYKMKICPICNKAMIYTHLARHMRSHAKQSYCKLIDEIKTDQERNKEEFEKGLFIKDYILQKKIDPKTLRREHQKAVKTSIDSPSLDVVLKPWQEKLLKLMKPSEREIIWIIGKDGNEGKSWFQKYLKNTYGSSKVFQAAIKKSADGVLHALSKRIVSLIDLFIFNVPRSYFMDDFPYGMLEELKDGNALSTKYESSILELNTPNIVVVFSNEAPEKYRMSKDRWTVYNIREEYLYKSNGYKVE